MAAMGIVFCHDDVTVFVKDINGKGEKICRIFGPGISSNFAIESGFFTVGHVFSMFLDSGFIKYNLMRTMQQQEEWLRLICRGGWCWMFGCGETMRNCWVGPCCYPFTSLFVRFGVFLAIQLDSLLCHAGNESKEIHATKKV